MSLIEELQAKYPNLDETQITETLKSSNVEIKENYKPEDKQRIFDYFRDQHGEPEKIEESENMELSIDGEERSEIDSQLEVLASNASHLITEESLKGSAQYVADTVNTIVEIFAEKVNQKLAGNAPTMSKRFQEETQGILAQIKKPPSLISRTPKLIQSVDVKTEKLITPSSQENLPPS